jgi:hypothetical protein
LRARLSPPDRTTMNRSIAAWIERIAVFMRPETGERAYREL